MLWNQCGDVKRCNVRLIFLETKIKTLHIALKCRVYKKHEKIKYALDKASICAVPFNKTVQRALHMT